MNYSKLKAHALKSDIVKDARFVGMYDFGSMSIKQTAKREKIKFS